MNQLGEGREMSDDNMQPKQEQWLSEEEVYDSVTFDGGGGVDDITTKRKLCEKLTRNYGNPADLDHALANAEHWMGKCEELERQIQQLQHESRGIGMVSKAEVDRIVEDALHRLKAQVARAVWTEWNRKMIPNERDTIIALILKLGITPSLAEREPSEPTPELRKEASDEASN
jgi:hypothetical protein